MKNTKQYTSTIIKIVIGIVLILLLYKYIIEPDLFTTRLQNSNSQPHFTDKQVAIKVVQIHADPPTNPYLSNQLQSPSFINSAGHYIVQTDSGDLLYDGNVIDSGKFDQIILSEDGKHFGYIKDSGNKKIYVDGKLVFSDNANNNLYLYAISDNGQYFYSYIENGKIQIYRGSKLLSEQPYISFQQNSNYPQNYNGKVNEFQISPDGKYYSFYSVGHYFFNNKEIMAPAELLNTLLNFPPVNNLLFYVSGNSIDFFTFSDNGKHIAYAVNGTPTFPDGGVTDHLYVDGRSTIPDYLMEIPNMNGNPDTYIQDEDDGTFQINNEGKVAALPGYQTKGIIMQNIHFTNFSSDVYQINREQTHVLSTQNSYQSAVPEATNYLLDGKPIKLPLGEGRLVNTNIVLRSSEPEGVELYGNTVYAYEFVQY